MTHNRLVKMRPHLEFSAIELHHESALADYLSEFALWGETTIHGYFGNTDWGHAETVKRLASWSKGHGNAGWVANTTYFLMKDGRILGNYNFRHELTESLKLCGGNCGYSVRPSERRKGYGTILLAHAKDFGRTLGLTGILLTCNVENIGSSRVIERNGGVLEDIFHNEESGERFRRYWITL